MIIDVTGDFFVVSEDDKSLKFGVQMTFLKDKDSILIEGSTLGISAGSQSNDVEVMGLKVYENVFKSGILDLVEIQAKGEILPNKELTIKSLNLSSYGILGRSNCYTNPNLLSSLSQN